MSERVMWTYRTQMLKWKVLMTTTIELKTGTLQNPIWKTNEKID